MATRKKCSTTTEYVLNIVLILDSSLRQVSLDSLSIRYTMNQWALKAHISPGSGPNPSSLRRRGTTPQNLCL